MRLLYVHERFGALAGAEANVLLTARELALRGHTVGLIHGALTGKGEMAWREAFSENFPLGGNSNSSAALAALESFSPDVAYVHKMSDLAVLEALADSGVPVVRMVHDHDLYCMRSYKYHYFNRQICRRPVSAFCLFPCGAFMARNQNGGFPLRWVKYSAKRKEIRLNRRFHRLVVASNYMKHELLRNGFDADRIEIHAPVPPAASLGSPNHCRDGNRLIFAGQIIRGKGVDVLLESLALVKVPFECFIFGEGNHRPFCEKLSHKLGLDRRVHFKGFVSQEELTAFYRASSLMVLSSVWPEPFGAVGLEGMRHGLPVVAFDAGGIREWLIDGHNGFLVPWMDRAQFAARVEELLLNQVLARQLGERGRQLVTKHYDLTRYITGLEDLFARVVAGTRQEVLA